LGVNFGDAPDRRPNFGDALISHNAKKKVHCCCAMLARMNQTMVKMNTTMSLTAIDKRLMMKQAIVLALLTLSAPMAPLDGDVVT
jgi:hypothetical protein